MIPIEVRYKHDYRGDGLYGVIEEHSGDRIADYLSYEEAEKLAERSNRALALARIAEGA